MLRLNSQVPRYDGFTPAQRVPGRTPKMPTGAVGNPFRDDFENPRIYRRRKHRKRWWNRVEFKKPLWKVTSVGNLIWLWINRFGAWKANNSFYDEAVCFCQRNGGNKADLKWQGHVAIIGGIGRKGDVIYFRWNSMDVDLNDLRPANRIFWRSWLRWGFSFTSGENKIPDPLFGGIPSDGDFYANTQGDFTK